MRGTADFWTDRQLWLGKGTSQTQTSGCFLFISCVFSTPFCKSDFLLRGRANQFLFMWLFHRWMNLHTCRTQWYRKRAFPSGPGNVTDNRVNNLQTCQPYHSPLALRRFMCLGLSRSSCTSQASIGFHCQSRSLQYTSLQVYEGVSRTLCSCSTSRLLLLE